jgi:hypothetical protein
LSDPYLDLGPMHPAGDVQSDTPSAPALPDDTEDFDDEVEDDSLSLAGPEGDDADEAGEAEDEQEPDDADAEEPEENDQDWLLERAKKADEYERLMAQNEAQARQREAEEYWNSRLDNAVRWFSNKRESVYQQAEQSLNPLGYLREKLNEVDLEERAWMGQFRDAREQALWQFAERQATPNYAARVAEHFGLPKESITELLEYPVELMEREAIKLRNRLIKERNRQKEVDKLKRNAAARKRAAKTVAPGSGRGPSGKIAAGSDAHYLSIPWSGGR